jgi:sulfur carrier protein ThiS
MYDNNKLTVMDAAIQAAFSRDGLFAKKGDDLKYTINGKRHTIRGEFGESAQIYVNDEPVTFNHPIRSNDKITIEAATVGKTANVKLFGIEGFNETVTYNVNGDDISLPVLAKVNNKFEKGDYQIKSGDKVELPCNYTLEMVMDYMKITPFNIIMTVNGNVVDLDYELEPNDVIELNDGSVSNSESKPSHQEEDGGDKLLVIVNDKPVVMKGKSSYTFVDVFNYIDFDTTRMQGNGIATIVNGQDAIYTQPLHAGDKIDIYWK